MIKRILFYTHSPRAFRTTLIGYLYEICQVYPTILLSEKLDFETEKALSNKKLFPKLERIVPINQFSEEKKGLFNKNKYLFKIAKKAIEEFKPAIVIAGSDMHSMFEMYLMRFSKRRKALNIAIQPSNIINNETVKEWVDLINSHLRFPSFLPFWLKHFFTKCRKYLGHLVYYYVMPLSVGEKPFFGKSSYILRKGNSGMRDADYQIIFSKRDYNMYIKDGVSPQKLFILSHPLKRNKFFLNEIFFKEIIKSKNNKKTIILMLPTDVEFGFRRNNNSLICKEEREKDWIDAVKLIVKIFPDWKIYIKPHPDSKDIDKIREKLGSISENIEFISPKEPVDKYVEMADVIIELPLSVSTVLFTASLQCPEKPIISLDFFKELLGDYYKNFEGIEYVDNREQFVESLELIKNDKYKKNSKIELKEGSFQNLPDLLEYLFKNKELSSKNAK